MLFIFRFCNEYKNKYLSPIFELFLQLKNDTKSKHKRYWIFITIGKILYQKYERKKDWTVAWLVSEPTSFLTDIAQSTLYVSETNGKITGMVVLSPEIPAEYKTVLWRQNNGKVNSIHRLAVHPKLKTHGLAKKLLEFVESLAKARGYSIIRLDTYSNNPLARNFYIRNGYQYSGNIHLEFMPGLYHCFEKAI